MSTRRNAGPQDSGTSNSRDEAPAQERTAGIQPDDSSAVDIARPSWDRYEVWVTRVKEPRELTARRRQKGRAAIEGTLSPDISDTARLRALKITPSS